MEEEKKGKNSPRPKSNALLRKKKKDWKRKKKKKKDKQHFVLNEPLSLKSKSEKKKSRCPKSTTLL